MALPGAGTLARALDTTRLAIDRQEFAPGYLTDIPGRARLNDVSANKRSAVPVTQASRRVRGATRT